MATRLWLPRDGPSESVSGVRDENKNAAVNGSWDEHFATVDRALRTRDENAPTKFRVYGRHDSSTHPTPLDWHRSLPRGGFPRPLELGTHARVPRHLLVRQRRGQVLQRRVEIRRRHRNLGRVAERV